MATAIVVALVAVVLVASAPSVDAAAPGWMQPAIDDGRIGIETNIDAARQGSPVVFTAARCRGDGALLLFYDHRWLWIAPVRFAVEVPADWMSEATQRSFAGGVADGLTVDYGADLSGYFANHSEVRCPEQPPSSWAAPSPILDPSLAPSVQPSPTNPVGPVGPGTLALATEAAAVVNEPGGSQWALLEPDHHVLVVDVLNEGETDWYRVEFEFCCQAGAPSEWVFGWVAANLEVAGLSSPGWGIPAPETLVGPTLQAVDWTCPDRPEDLYRIPEPVRHQCYDIAETITMRGVLSGGLQGEALYPGDPAYLTALPSASFVPPGMESGYRSFPLHMFADPLTLAWLNDDRVKRGELVEITGSFGPGAVACTKAPRLEGFPRMSPEEQQLWCAQQFLVGEIHGHGPDPVVEAPIADPLWTPPPGVQPESGDGWRLLASSTANQLAVTVSSEIVDVALTAEEFPRLWFSQSGGAPPQIDFDSEFVVQFVPPISSTCPWIAFTGVGVDMQEGLMYGEFEQLSAELFLDEVSANFGCTSDASPHAFLVAVDRSVAPGIHFRLRLRDERLCEECGITWDETVVHTDE